jgi:hypothetical protein
MLDRRVSFKGAILDTGERALGLLTAMAARISHGSGSLPDKIAWPTADKRPLTVTKKELVSLQGAMTDWIHRNYQACWDHKEALEALESIEAAERYDIRKGWPDTTL